MNSDWLKNRDAIRNSSFEDKHYLVELYEEFKDYLYKCPTVIKTEWSEDRHKIICKIGSHKKSFKVNTKVSPKDFVTMIELWAYKYYPKYLVNIEQEIPLDIEERVKAITDKGLSLEESLSDTKKVISVEKGIITRVFIPEDRFTILVNGKKSVRLSGTLFNPLPLSSFLKTLRSLYIESNNMEIANSKIREYINSNSIIDNSEVKEKEILINYVGKQLDNFFIINRKELSKNEIIEVSDKTVRIGRFLITFYSEDKKNELLSKFETYKLKKR